MRSFLKRITPIFEIILNETSQILFHFLTCLGNSEVLVMDLGFNTSGWGPRTLYFPTETRSLCHVTDPNLIDSYAFSSPILPSPLNSLCCKHTAEPLCRSVTQTHTQKGFKWKHRRWIRQLCILWTFQRNYPPESSNCLKKNQGNPSISLHENGFWRWYVIEAVFGKGLSRGVCGPSRVENILWQTDNWIDHIQRPPPAAFVCRCSG